MDRMGHVLPKQNLTRARLKHSSVRPHLVGSPSRHAPVRNTGDACVNRRGSSPRLFPLNLLNPTSNRTRMTSTMPPPLPNPVPNIGAYALPDGAHQSPPHISRHGELSRQRDSVGRAAHRTHAGPLDHPIRQGVLLPRPASCLANCWR